MKHDFKLPFHCVKYDQLGDLRCDCPLNWAVYPAARDDIERAVRPVRKWKHSVRREGDEVIKVVGVATRVRDILELRHEGTIERKEVLV